MPITLTVFAASPDEGRGLARDMGVRWALEEAGVAYDVRTLSFAAMKQPAHRARQPFGQIPTYEEDGLILFESGAIILHIAQHHAGLLPDDPYASARAIAWLFAALSTVEPPIIARSMAGFTIRDKPWYDEQMALLDDQLRVRLTDLSRQLGDAPWLEQAFSAGDLMMIVVLRRLAGTGLLE
ncbi:MAG: glutathione S-transferase, partial [Pseudomonadota bacterium]|nr:glutathione S-transferase [Pseudomonadota bacterium]